MFDDADLEMEEAGLLGLAAVPLASLAEGVPLHGSFPLYNRQREVTGHVVVSVQWKAPFAPSQVAGNPNPNLNHIPNLLGWISSRKSNRCPCSTPLDRFFTTPNSNP